MLLLLLIICLSLNHQSKGQLHDDTVRLYTKQYIHRSTLAALWPKLKKFALANSVEKGERKYDHYYLYYLALESIQKIEDDRVIQCFTNYTLPTTSINICPESRQLIFAAFQRAPKLISENDKQRETEYFNLLDPLSGEISVHRHNWFFSED